jgi:diguanylate cyclase (GGDEF)-like protein
MGIGFTLQAQPGAITLRRFTLAAVTAVAFAAAAWAAEAGPLATLHSIVSLTKSQAGQGLPVAFEATVTYYNPNDVDLFVQDEGEAIYVEVTPGANWLPGDRVLVRGKTRDSFNTDVLAESVTLRYHGAVPKPVPADFTQLIRAERDCMRVSVHATVRSADKATAENIHGTYLKLLMDGGYIDATVIGSDPAVVKQLLDAEVDITGVVSGKFDSKMQLIGVLIEVSSLADVKVVKRAPISRDARPITPMDQILASYAVQDRSTRVRVRGSITYYQPGSAVVLQDGNRSLWIATHTSTPMQIGDVAEATGFPDSRAGYLALTDGEIEDTNIFQPVQPQPSNWKQLSTWNSGDPTGHQNDLVSIEGVVAATVREDAQDEFDLISDGKLFTAIYRHPPANPLLPPMRDIPAGTRIRVTGICMAVQAANIDPVEQEVPFNILLRSFDDIAVVAQPSLLNTRNLIILVGLLLAVVVAVGGRAWAIERRMRHEAASLGHIEQRRSLILEDINGSRPLAEIVEQITELATAKLGGAPCWCQITDGARLGKHPVDVTGMRIAACEISSHNGAAAGAIFAAFDSNTKPTAHEPAALSMAVSLAALAIETRRLYSDLHHRSEFDLLTDIHNRFSLDKHLDALINEARDTAGIFGLIYIDLDDFKLVNDEYGHRIGDLYLQEVAQRMKRQLRGGDMLARLGGDEFAVLVAVVHTRAEVQEIAARLAHSLTALFAVDDCIAYGSASVGIAIYPEDGATRDSLFNAADDAMYADKRAHKESADASAGQRRLRPASRSRS